MVKHRFFVKKNFEYIKRYHIVEKSVLDKFFEFVDKIKSKGKGKEGKKAKKSTKGVNLTLLFVLFFTFLIIGVIVYFVMLIQLAPPPQSLPPHLSVVVKNMVYGSYGTIFDKGKGTWLSFILFPKNSNDINLLLYPLPKDSVDIVPNIYILKTGFFDTSEDAFFKFSSYLKEKGYKHGFAVEFINFNEIKNVPPGSFIIVASGRFPLELSYSFKDLIKRKINFVYIGGIPSENAVDLKGNLVSLPEERDPVKIFSSSIRHVNLEPRNLTIRNAVYELTGSSKIRGVVSRLIYKNKDKGRGGMFIVFPTTLEEGWSSMENAASDVISVLTDPSLIPVPKLNRAIPERFHLNTSEKHLVFKNRYSLSKGKYLFLFKASAPNMPDSYYLYSTYFMDDDKGYLYPTSGPSLLTMDLSKKPITFNYKIEGSGKKNLDLIVYDSSLHPVDHRIVEVFFGDEGNFKYYNENLSEGVYLFVLKDKDRRYVKSIITFSPLKVVADPDFDSAKFNFKFFVGDRKVVVDQVEVWYNGQVYKDKKVNHITINLASNFGGKAPSGYYYFTIKSGKFVKDIKLYNPPKTAIARILFGNPINMALLILSAIIFTIGSFIKPKLDNRFFIDIPDFPPMEKVKISISKEEVFQVMEDVNNYYRWKHTPLKISEIKMGFRRIIKNGNPLLIGDFNLEYILEKLVDKGYVKKVLDYYGLSKWEKESGFSIEELALFRKLRDICVEHAIPFTNLVKKRYNVKITLMFKENYVLFFTPEKEFLPLVRKSLHLVKSSQVIILTLENDEKELLLDYIYQSGKEVSLFRHYIERGLVSIMTVDEFENMVKELGM